MSMKLDDYLLMVRKQARRGLAKEIQCAVHIDAEGNVVAAGSEKTCATVHVDIYAPYSPSDPLCKNIPLCDIWGHEFGPERDASIIRR